MTRKDGDIETEITVIAKKDGNFAIELHTRSVGIRLTGRTTSVELSREEIQTVAEVVARWNPKQ